MVHLKRALTNVYYLLDFIKPKYNLHIFLKSFQQMMDDDKEILRQ